MANVAHTAAYMLLCADIGLAPGSVPEATQKLMDADLAAARQRLGISGIHVDDSNLDDLQLTVMYAAWLYRGRVNGQPMPQMLLQAIRDRQTADGTGGGA
jgi:hypothetical protein